MGTKSKGIKRLLNLCLGSSLVFTQCMPKVYAFDQSDIQEVKEERVQVTTNKLEELKKALEDSNIEESLKKRLMDAVLSIPRYYNTYYTKDSITTLDQEIEKLQKKIQDDSNHIDDTYVNGVETSIQQAVSSLKYQKGTVPQIYITTADGKGNELEKWETDADGNRVEVGYKDNTGIAIVPGEDDKINTLLEDKVGRIKVRGNTTSLGEKKPYNFKLLTKQSVLGMANAKTWVLLANHFDPTLLRNYLVFEFGKHLGLEYTPKQQQVEVWMDGVLKGTYTLMEKIDSIVELNTEANDFMIELEAQGDPEDGVTYIKTSKNLRFAVSEPEAPTDEQLVNIETVLRDIETALDSGNYSEVQEKIDTASFAKYYVLNEYWKTLDIKYSSVYFYYKNGKIYAGPIWDYDLSTGNTNPHTVGEYWPNGDSTKGLYAAGSTWFPYLMKYEGFYKEVMDLFGEQKNFMRSIYYRGGLIDQTLNQYKDIYKRNFTSVENGGAGWDERYANDYMYSPVKSYEENVEYLRDWLDKRFTWMDSELDELLKKKIEYKEEETTIDISSCEVTLNDNSYVYDGTEKEPAVTVKNGETVLEKDKDYTVSYANNTDAGTATVTVTGKGNYKGTVKKEFTIEKADQSFTASVDTNNIIVNESTNISVEGAQGTVSYQSDNAKIATVDKDGKVSGVAVGTATITVTAAGDENYNEATQTIKITVLPADLTGYTLTLNPEECVYNGTEQKPAVTVSKDGKDLVKDTDYTVSYANNTEAGEATVTVTGKGNYKGTLTKTFTIKKANQTWTVTADKTSIKVEESAQLTLSGQQGTVTYESSDNDIATVDSNGKVTGVAEGTVTITVKAAGNNNYNEATQTITITVTALDPVDLAGSIVTLAPEEHVYDGNKKEPAVTVSKDGNNLVKDKDYTVSYKNNTNAGTATVIITGIGKYTGTVEENFTIEKAEQSFTATVGKNSIKVNELTNISVTDAQGTVSYQSDNAKIATVDGNGNVTGVAVGKATITVTAAETNNYKKGTQTIEITVSQADLTGYTLTVEPKEYVYDGSAKMPTVTVSKDGKDLVKGTDYTVSYTNNINAGTATVTVTGKGNYTGTLTKAFTIQKADQTWTVNADKTSINIKDSAQLTVTGQQGNVTYTSNNVDIATVDGNGKVTGVSKGEVIITVKASGNNNYNEATKTIKITVSSVDLAGCTVTLDLEQYVYDGTAKEPTVTVKDGETVLVKGTDYEVTYTNNTNAGEATVTITGIGKYSGTVEKKFTIEKAAQAFTATVGKNSIKVNESTNIAVTDAKGTVSYVSSDDKIATVDNNGNVTGVAVGKATITVTAAGTDNYKEATKTIEITVLPIDLTGSTVTLDSEEYVYDGTAKMPTVTVNNGGTVLVQGRDYTVSYTNNTNAGTAIVTITGIGNYAGTLTKRFTIQKADQVLIVTADKESMRVGDIAQLTVSGAKEALTYESSDDNIATVDGNGKVSGVSEGRVTISVTAAGSTNYNEGKKTIDIIVKQVTAIDIHTCTITVDKVEFIYNGTAQEPVVTIKNGTTTLIMGTDYEVRYENNINAGVATIIINGIGEYTGTVKQTFTIAKAGSTVVISSDLSKEYDGKAVAQPEVVSTGSTGTISFEWYTMDGVALGNAPVEVGKYKVKVILAEDMNHTGATAEYTFTISKVVSSIMIHEEEVAKLNKIYDGQPVQIPHFIQIGNPGKPIFEWYVLRESATKAAQWVLLSEAPSEVGIYKFVIRVPEDEHYTEAYKEVEFKISEKPLVEDNETGDQISGVETGDTTQAGLWTIIVGLSAIVLAFFTKKKYMKQ